MIWWVVIIFTEVVFVYAAVVRRNLCNWCRGHVLHWRRCRQWNNILYIVTHEYSMINNDYNAYCCHGIFITSVFILNSVNVSELPLVTYWHYPSTPLWNDLLKACIKKTALAKHYPPGRRAIIFSPPGSKM